MDKIQNLLEQIRNIQTEQIINVMFALLIIVVFFILSSFIPYIILKYIHKKDKKSAKNTEKKKAKQYPTYRPLKLFIIVLGVYISTFILGLSEEADAFCYKVFKLVSIAVAAYAVSSLFHPEGTILTRVRDSSKFTGNEALTGFISKIIKLIAYIIAGYIIIKELGYDLGVLAAGLGISSVVIALAAQDLAKNIFAGFAIISDRSFIVGDTIEINGVTGTVEDISFRSTKLKGPQGDIITIQNLTLSTSIVKKIGETTQRTYTNNLKLPLETPKVTIEKLTNRIKFILKYNKKVNHDSIRVYFNKIEADGININIRVTTNIIEYNEYTSLCEELNLTILNILESQNVQLAYPGQNVYFRDTDKIKAEKKEIKKLK